MCVFFYIYLLTFSMPHYVVTLHALQLSIHNVCVCVCFYIYLQHAPLHCNTTSSGNLVISTCSFNL